MAIHSSILAWRIPWTEEPGGYHSWGCKESDATERLILLLLKRLKTRTREDSSTGGESDIGFLNITPINYETLL